MEISPAYCDVIVIRRLGLGGERKVLRVRKGKEKDVTAEWLMRESAKTA